MTDEQIRTLEHLIKSMTEADGTETYHGFVLTLLVKEGSLVTMRTVAMEILK